MLMSQPLGTTKVPDVDASARHGALSRSVQSVGVAGDPVAGVAGN